MNTYKLYRYSYCCTSPANRYQLTATIQAKSIRAAKLMFSKIWSGAGYITDEMIMNSRVDLKKEIGFFGITN